MLTGDAKVPPGSAPDHKRRILSAWVAEQAEVLDDEERDALAAEVPSWRADAAQLIAEGLLAYVVLEMVAPDLAIARAEGRQQGASDVDLTNRLEAHLQDFLDYRAELQERGGLQTERPPGQHDH
jgi:hypothetical protein